MEDQAQTEATVDSQDTQDNTAPFLEEAIKEGGELDREVFIIGGGEIYRQALPHAHKLYLTIVESNAEGNIFFPEWEKDFKKETFREERLDEKTGLKYTSRE